MKKLLILLIGLLLPLTVFAKTYYDDYATMNLKETVEAEGLEFANKNYKETDKQVTIYLFRGQGCGFCHRLIEYLNSISTEYGQYFKVVSFEVWNDQKNNQLFNKMPTITGVAAEGIPYYIIGEETLDGYNETYNDKIINAIMKEYNNPTKDVFEKLDELENGSKSSGGDTVAIIFWNFVVVALGCGTVIYFMNRNKKEIMEALNNHNYRSNKYEGKTR